jgi:hypothetical protein
MKSANRKTAIEQALIPTWLRVKLLRLQGGDRSEDQSYLNVGYHLGRYGLNNFIEDESITLDIDVSEVMNRPTQVLRRIFANEDHPRAEFVDLIPRKHRRQFLLGLLAGVDEENGPDDYWLSRAA